MTKWTSLPTDESPKSQKLSNKSIIFASWLLYIASFALGAVISAAITYRMTIDDVYKSPNNLAHHLSGYSSQQASTGYVHPSYFLYAEEGRQNEPNEFGLVLDGRALQLGIHSFGDPSRIRRFMQKIADNESIVISAMGASIMAGHGASWANDMEETFPDTFMRIVDWFGTTYPDNSIKAVNGAMGGTTSMLHDSCVDVLLPEDADLVIVEEAVGDTNCDQWHCNADKLQAVERLLRKILNMKNKPAVVMLNAYGYRFSQSEFHNSPESEVNTIASFYKLPILSVRTSMYHYMTKELTGFKTSETAVEIKRNNKPAEARLRMNESFYWDGVHPYGPSGARYMADLVIGFLQMAGASVATSPFNAAGEMRYVEEQLPEPMLPGNFESLSTACFFHSLLEKAAADYKGFEWKSEAPGALSIADQKWGWIAEKPKSWITFKVDTTIPEDAPKGRHTKIGVGYLASYENMGKAMVSCVENCECKQKVLDGHWTSRFSLLQIYNLRVSEHKECVIKVEVLSSTKSGGHKVKIASLTMFV